MQVVTLNQKDFDAACFILADEIVKDCQPTVIVGVLNGGATVAELVCAKLSKDTHDIKYFEVSASRRTTEVKRKVNVNRLFSVLPFFVLNLLRKIEHYLLMLTMRFRVKQERNVRLDKILSDYLAQLTEGCIYIIDDAIDSGATIKYLLDELRSINPLLDYRVGVLVVTQSSPMVVPDTALYSGVLLRFPWSNDYRL